MRHGRPLPRRPGQHCVAGGPDTTVHRLNFVARPEKMVRNGLGREADFSYWQCYEALVSRSYGPIAQLDRVTDFYSVGCRFESCWDRQRFQQDARSVLVESVALRTGSPHYAFLLSSKRGTRQIKSIAAFTERPAGALFRLCQGVRGLSGPRLSWRPLCFPLGAGERGTEVPRNGPLSSPGRPPVSQGGADFEAAWQQFLSKDPGEKPAKKVKGK
jgi:hypothetical protein